MMTTTPYGTWQSPITAEMAAKGGAVIQSLIADGDDTYWAELRPANKGRSTIVWCDSNGTILDITPPTFNVRARVHEYGGAPFCVHEGKIYASNGDDNAVYCFEKNKEPRKVTPGQTLIETPHGAALKGTRFADFVPVPAGLIAVSEAHEPGKETENFLALIDPNTGNMRKIASGHDFYASSALSPDAKKLAWITWDHPEMPWTHTQLWLADIDAKGNLSPPQLIAGQEEEAVFQPQWSPEGILYFISDRDNGWWNLHRYYNGAVQNVCQMEAEAGVPLWVLGLSTYAFLGEDIIFTYNRTGRWHLACLNLNTRKATPIDRPSILQHQLRNGHRKVVFLEGYLERDEAVVQLDDHMRTHVLYAKPSLIDEGYISAPQHIAFPSNGRTAYGIYYPPKNKEYSGPEGQKPPLIVMIHGGPTSQAKGTFALKNQFWTSHGFAILDVNYGGSTGYGRSYRMLLNRNWGIVDVEDCVNGAEYLAAQGLVDKNKMFIRGGSAGGFTTLAVLVHSKAFRAGANYYGVADLTALAHDTHKFESRYLEGLLGKYPQEEAIWKARSPIHAINKITTPLIIFQGEEDRVVPPNQSVMIYEALKKKGISTELHLYPGEDHGFRQESTLIDSLQKELDFYRRAFVLN